MRALTLWRPWPEPIAVGIKPVENRPWRPSDRLLEEMDHLVCIHGGKKYDYPGAVWMEDNGLWTARWPENSPEGIVCVMHIKEIVTEMRSPWFTGPYGWVFDRGIKIDPPIPCRGHQGLWNLPPDVEAQVRERMSQGDPRVAATQVEAAESTAE